MNTAAATKVHYMGEVSVMNTACGRYVSLTDSPILWTPVLTNVTCLTCLRRAS